MKRLFQRILKNYLKHNQKIEHVNKTKKQVDKQLKTNDDVLFVDGFTMEELTNISKNPQYGLTLARRVTD